MGLCLGKSTTEAASSCWLDLPPDIVGEVLSRLPTHEDRLNFKTVCRQWHLAARQQGALLPPAVPCIQLGRGMYQSIATDDNGTKVCRRRFAMPAGIRVTAIFGGWVLFENRTSGRFFLRDPFSPSTTAIEVPCKYDRRVISPRARTPFLHKHWLFALKKIIVCSPRLVVALTSYNVVIDASADFACFRPETTVVLWTRDSSYSDIAFYCGKLFAIDSKEHLFSHWLVREEQSHSPTNPRDFFFSYGYCEEAPSRSRTKHVIKEGPAILAAAAQNYHHLVTSFDGQKLLMVRWSIPNRTNNNKADNWEMNLQVFEADLDKGRWSEVKDLGSQVLFVGQTGSRAFTAEGSSKNYYGRRFRGGNRVFVLGHDWALAQRQANVAPSRCLDHQKHRSGIPSYCVYNMVTGKTSLVSLNGGHCSMKSSKAQWIFPSK